MLVHDNVSKWMTRPLPMNEQERAELQKYEATISEKNRLLAEANDQQEGEHKKVIDSLKKELAGAEENWPAWPKSDGGRRWSSDRRLQDLYSRQYPPSRSCCAARILASCHDGHSHSDFRERKWSIRIGPLDCFAGKSTHGARLCEPCLALFDGRGLVRTVDNFGTAGEAPSHPELLDYLADTFVKQGWSTKQLIREIVMSHAYRTSTAANEQAAAADPENRLLWRMNRKRLDAESLRDAILLVSGKLDLTIGGRNILDPAVLDKSDGDRPTEYGYVFSDTRRSVYTPAFRNRMHELFEVFDFADQNGVVAQRNVTTAAPQALLSSTAPS